MAREIPRDQALTAADRQYLTDRCRWHDIIAIDAEYPPSEDVADVPRPDDVRMQVPHPSTLGTNPADGTDDEDDEYDEDPEYEKWTKAELQKEIDDRNIDRDSESQIARTGTNLALAKALRDDDDEAAEDEAGGE